MATATATVVFLAARSGLDTHRDTIGALHLLGSTDGQVARLFQRRIALDTLWGGLAGTVLALATVAVLGRQAAALGSDLVDGVGLTRGRLGRARVAAVRVRAARRDRRARRRRRRAPADAVAARCGG